MIYFRRSKSETTFIKSFFRVWINLNFVKLNIHAKMLWAAIEWIKIEYVISKPVVQEKNKEEKRNLDHFFKKQERRKKRNISKHKNKVVCKNMT